MKLLNYRVGRISGLVMVAAILLLAHRDAARAQGTFSPVTEATVVDLKLNHYFSPERKAHDPDFEWSFTESEFVMKKGKGPIPAVLLERMFPRQTTVDEVRGKWRLSKGGGELTLTDIKAGDKVANKEVSFPIYKTAPTVVRIGEPQFVFGVDRVPKKDATK